MRELRLHSASGTKIQLQASRTHRPDLPLSLPLTGVRSLNLGCCDSRTWARANTSNSLSQEEKKVVTGDAPWSRRVPLVDRVLMRSEQRRFPRKKADLLVPIIFRAWLDEVV